MLAAWLHDLSPYALRISGDFGLRWYGLSYAAAFLVGWLLLRWLGRRGAILIPPDRAGDAILYAVVGVVVGGRLGYCLFYEPRLFLEFTGTPPWWGLLAINRGGMASHGGMIGVITAAWFIARLPQSPATAVAGPSRPAPVLHILDALSLITPPGLMLGRIANFINGELLGRVYADPGRPAPWWTVRFPQEVEVGAHGLAPDIHAKRLGAITDILNQENIPGNGFDDRYHTLVTMIQHGRHDLAARLEPFLSARYPSQLFQAFAEGIILGAFLWLLARRPRKPGVIGGWFLIAYGLLRILTELWRLPDAQLAVQRILGLSRGQWLSVAMVIAGLIGLAIVTRRPVPKLGGWAKPAASSIAS